MSKNRHGRNEKSETTMKAQDMTVKVAQTPSAWEHKVDKLPMNRRAWEQQLDEWGADGWMLVCVDKIAYDEIWAVMQRPGRIVEHTG